MEDTQKLAQILRETGVRTGEVHSIKVLDCHTIQVEALKGSKSIRSYLWKLTFQSVSCTKAKARSSIRKKLRLEGCKKTPLEFRHIVATETFKLALSKGFSQKEAIKAVASALGHKNYRNALYYIDLEALSLETLKDLCTPQQKIVITVLEKLLKAQKP